MGGKVRPGVVDRQGQGRIVLSGGSARGRRGGDGPREGLPAPGTQPAGGGAHGSPPWSGRTGLETVYHCGRSSRVASAGIPGTSGPQGGDGAGEGWGPAGRWASPEATILLGATSFCRESQAGHDARQMQKHPMGGVPQVPQGRHASANLRVRAGPGQGEELGLIPGQLGRLSGGGESGCCGGSRIGMGGWMRTPALPCLPYGRGQLHIGLAQQVTGSWLPLPSPRGWDKRPCTSPPGGGALWQAPCTPSFLGCSA